MEKMGELILKSVLRELKIRHFIYHRKGVLLSVFSWLLITKKGEQGELDIELNKLGRTSLFVSPGNYRFSLSRGPQHCVLPRGLPLLPSLLWYGFWGQRWCRGRCWTIACACSPHDHVASVAVWLMRFGRHMRAPGGRLSATAQRWTAAGNALG